MRLTESDLAMLRYIEAELSRRDAIISDLFPEQLRFIEDQSRFKLITTNRRAGKSHAAVAATILDMLEHPNSQSYYIAKHINAAKAISLPMFRELNEKYGLGLKIREARNMVKYPNGSITYVMGSDASEALQGIRGIKGLRRVTIDEAGHIKLDLLRYVQSVLRPALTDCQGTLVLATTPSESKASYAWSVAKGDAPGWSIHQWSASDNPHTSEQVSIEIADILREMPAAKDAAWFRREWMGEWCFDESSFVYSFDKDLNTIDSYTIKEGDLFILGVDLGYYPDSTAFSLLCWNKKDAVCHELESYSATEMQIADIALRIRNYKERFPKMICIGDRSNKFVFEELIKRYRVKIMPALKFDKRALIELMNSDYKSGNIKIVENANRKHIEEMTELTWVDKGQDRVEDPGKHNDCCDAFLYAYRLSRHFRAKDIKAEQEPPKPGSPDWLRQDATQRKNKYVNRAARAAGSRP